MIIKNQCKSVSKNVQCQGATPVSSLGLTSQIRRAALSVPTNIVEGYARKGDKELGRFVSIASGSLAETEYLLGFSMKLGYLKKVDHERIEALRSEVGRLLWNFAKKVRV